MTKIKVLLADNREIFREGLAHVLGKTTSIEVVSSCSTGEETIHQAIKLKPDIIILDSDIMECDCFEVKHRVNELLPETRFIVVGPSTNESLDPLYVLKIKADGYVGADIHTIRLVEVINGVYGGRPFVAPVLGGMLLQAFNTAEERQMALQKIGLSEREKEVLTLVTKAFANKEIADSLFITENTVKVHLGRIFKKFDVHSRQKAAVLAREKRIIPE